MQKARCGQLERHPSASGVPPSRGGGSEATEHGVAACHLCGELERPAHGLPFTDWLDDIGENIGAGIDLVPTPIFLITASPY